MRNPTVQKSYSETKAESSRSCGVFKQILLTLAGGIFLSACGATHLNTKVSGNLSNLSASNTVAILPAVAEGEQPKAMADLFRQSLHAHLKQSNFNLLEPYIVDSQLENSGLTDPSRFWELDPMRFGEALGVDAVLITRINKMEKSYLLLHSSIEMSFSARMVDTRSGEILWMAEQTETDFEGIGKIPTGLAAAVIAPIYHVTNAMEIDRMTSQMVDKLTSLVRFPDRANREGTFQEPMIANAWNRQESGGHAGSLEPGPEQGKPRNGGCGESQRSRPPAHRHRTGVSSCGATRSDSGFQGSSCACGKQNFKVRRFRRRDPVLSSALLRGGRIR